MGEKKRTIIVHAFDDNDQAGGIGFGMSGYGVRQEEIRCRARVLAASPTYSLGASPARINWRARWRTDCLQIVPANVLFNPLVDRP